MVGYRESDRLVICTNTYHDMVVTFTVMDCTNFSDKHRPDWRQMQKLALHIGSVRVSKRTAGFNTFADGRPVVTPDVDDEEEDDEEDEAARLR